MATNLAIKALVTRPDGTAFFRQEYEWWDLPEDIMTAFAQKMVKMETLAQELAGKKEDDANLSAVLSSTVDGVAQKPVSVTGISYKALTKFQRAFWKEEDDIIKLGEEKAKHK